LIWKKKQKEIVRTLQVLLWLWFGVMTSFVSTNVVNIARLETEVKVLHKDIEDLQNRIISLKQHTTSK
jgi:cell division protein FtsB